MNIEKYNMLHKELMKKLELGEITVENAKEVNELAFEKYITEAVSPKSALKKIKTNIIKTKQPEWLLNNIRPDAETNSKIEQCYENLKKIDPAVKQAITDYFNKNNTTKKQITSFVKFTPLTDKFFCIKQRDTNKNKIHIIRCYGSFETKGLGWTPNSTELIDAIEKVLYKKANSEAIANETITFMYKENIICGMIVFDIKEEHKEKKEENNEVNNSEKTV